MGKSHNLTEASGFATNESLDVSVGQVVKRHRRKRVLTLSELSKLSGISTAMISRIENGQSSPSLSSLEHIASALQIPVVSLFERTPKSMDINLVRADQGLSTVRVTPEETHSYKILGQHSDSEISFVSSFVSLRKGQIKELPTYFGEGYIFIRIQSGSANYRCGEELFTLEAGDSISFDARISNGFESLVSEEMSFLSVVARKN